jgi:hypothetical protein
VGGSICSRHPAPDASRSDPARPAAPRPDPAPQRLPSPLFAAVLQVSAKLKKNFEKSFEENYKKIFEKSFEENYKKFWENF